MNKLIIIRGPSGAGKSSVAKALLKNSQRPALHISVDQTRKLFSDQKTPDHQASKEMVVNNVLFGLESGYDVILDGILNINTDKFMFDRIFQAHPKENYFLFLDVGYEETLRRHNTRPEKSEFGEEQMKEWWGWSTPTKQPGETVIPETSSIEETVEIIRRIAGLSLKGNT